MKGPPMTPEKRGHPVTIGECKLALEMHGGEHQYLGFLLGELVKMYEAAARERDEAKDLLQKVAEHGHYSMCNKLDAMRDPLPVSDKCDCPVGAVMEWLAAGPARGGVRAAGDGGERAANNKTP